ncbi:MULTISPECIES: DUF6414 family protein [unclassified Rhodococcus (in: high G+C Gram-positive bacteria)]|uniref:DUF6414 family protein n=1 Tax=unclassified Rhodococcus (in: high G+C Gram-positive bacteria) TaxID=192944 RepID=UPI000A9EA52D|nr:MULTISPECIES: hypothetical protein [unclassified Rhodococcus (in: high G+C Gram-positive bacteria)]
MAVWSKKHNVPHDRQREFIYLDEVSVVSLLAGLQGEIKDSVTQTLARTEDRSVGASIGAAGVGLESRLGASRSSTNEVVRRAIIQSTFRDLWQRDIGVLLHDISGAKPKARRPISTLRELENVLPRLTKAKMAVPLNKISRGDIVEMEIEVRADRFFEMITVGTTFLDMMHGRENLFGVSEAEFREMAPMIEVLKELLVGLVPIRGVAASHKVVEISGQQIVIASELLGAELQTNAKPLEIVGFAESESFWRDLRRTLFSGSVFTMYARAEGPVLTERWSPIKIADLLGSLSPGLRNAVVFPFEQLNFADTPVVEAPDPLATARLLLTDFAAAYESATGATPSRQLVENAVVESTSILAMSTTIEQRRHAFEPVANAVAGPEGDREILQRVRADCINRSSMAVSVHDRVLAPPSTEPDETAVQLEVGFVALYW